MGAITGYVDFENDLSNDNKIIGAMTDLLCHRGPDASGVWLCNQAAIGHRRLAVVGSEDGIQPMVITAGEHKYVITYDGELYNTKELKYELEHMGHVFFTDSDTEVVLASFIQWKEGCLSRLNGIFAFGVWCEHDMSLFLGRDRFGIKPLFYTMAGNKLIFASEIKAILAHPNVETAIDKNGIAEVFGLGPARTPGIGVFKDIHELKPAHYLKYNQNGTSIRRYWQLISEEHTDNLSNTAEKVRYLVRDSITRQLGSDVPLCTILSGNLDSSAITTIAAGQYAFERGERIDTYSMDYQEGEKFFRRTIFQADSDKRWVDIISSETSSRHRSISVDDDAVISNLKNAVYARDLPGIADVDSALLSFYSQIKKRHTVAVSGQGADEVFGGHSWFYSQSDFDTQMFPWQQSLQQRAKLLNPDMAFYTDLEGYVNRRYTEAVKKTPRLKGENSYQARRREIFYLNLTWYMSQLLERHSAMSMASGLEVRLPFCDHRLAEYVWNIPWSMKALGGKEKGILCLALKGILPDDIMDRRKSTLPKTLCENYEVKVRELLHEVIVGNSPILDIINKPYIEELMRLPDNQDIPFFGTVASKARLYAYLVQVNMWMENYRISIK